MTNQTSDLVTITPTARPVHPARQPNWLTDHWFWLALGACGLVAVLWSYCASVEQRHQALLDEVRQLRHDQPGRRW